jgi:4'-phosphopantetheinyl transferase
MAPERWLPVPAGSLPALPPGEVHVWRFSLRLAPAALAAVERHLAPAERERAARFRFPEHRAAFVAGRGVQRELLGRYTDVEPGAVAYRESAHGKLALDGAAERTGVRFNLSNSGDLALLAVAVERELGVDLEQLRPMSDAMDVARRFFSAPENEVFTALDETVREAAFFRCWTRKEAYIKAVGEGLSMPLDRFDVAFAPGEEARLLATRGDPEEAARWTLVGLEPGPGYVGALAAEGGGWTLRRFEREADPRSEA